MKVENVTGDISELWSPVKFNQFFLEARLIKKQKYRRMFETQKSGNKTSSGGEKLVSALEHLQVPKWDRTMCPEE